MPAAGGGNTRAKQLKRKKKKSPIPRPSSNAQTYVSQGKAVERVANQQKRARKLIGKGGKRQFNRAGRAGAGVNTSQKYIDRIQAARGDAHPYRKGILSGFKLARGREAQRITDREALSQVDTVGHEDKSRKRTLGPPTPKSAHLNLRPTHSELSKWFKKFGSATGKVPRSTLGDRRLQKIVEHDRAQNVGHADTPRRDSEVRHYIKTGERPLRKSHPRAGAGADKGVASSGLQIFKESARGLHANAGALRGKNWWHEFKHGHDTGSDVLKSLGVKNKKLRAGAGFLLDIPLSGANLKAGAESSASLLERRAAKQEFRGKTAKAQATRKKAASAPRNRGVHIGVTAGVPFTARRGTISVGAKTTGKLSKKLKISAAGGRIHDSKLGQKVGRGFVPHYRHPDVEPEFHKKVEELRLKRTHRDAEVKKHAAHRGKAYDRAVGPTTTRAGTKHHPDEHEDFLRATEREVKDDRELMGGKPVTRTTAQHSELRAATNKITPLKRKAHIAEGKARVKAGQSSSMTLKVALAHAKVAVKEGSEKADHVLLDSFRKIRNTRLTAGKELAKARTAVRNAHTGAPQLYDDAARTKATARLKAAEAASASANAAYKVAETRIYRLAEQHTAQQARRESPDLSVAQLDRHPPQSLKVLETARANLQAGEARVRAAREAAKGVPKKETLMVNAKGEPLHDVIARTARHDATDFSPRVQEAAAAWDKERAALLAEQQEKGILGKGLPDWMHHTAAVPEGRAARKAAKGSTTPPHSKHRMDPRGILTGNKDRATRGEVQFETNPGRIVEKTVSEAKRSINQADFLTGLHEAAPKLTQSAHQVMNTETHGVYDITAKGIEEIKPSGVQQAIKSGKGVILPKATVAQEAVNETFRNNPGGSWWDTVTGAWKSGVTVYNLPFFQERNLYDDTLRAWYADTDASSYLKAIELVRGTVKAARNERTLGNAGIGGTVKVGRTTYTRDEFNKLMADHGVSASYFGSELKDQIGNSRIFNPTHSLRAVGERMEMVPRAATFLSALRKGMTPEDAGAWTRLHHFDYSDLTAAEKQVRRFIPFYTFTSRNIQLQARTLATRPGKFAAMQAFREEAAKYAGLPPDWDEKQLTDVQQRALPIPIRVGPKETDIKLLYLTFSPTDINRFPTTLASGAKPLEVAQQQFDLFMQMGHPVLKGVTEYLANHSFFFRGPIYQDKRNPTANHWVPAPEFVKHAPRAVRDALGFRTDFPDPETGKRIAVWNAKADWFIRQLPESGFVASLGTPVKNSRGQDAGDKVFGQLTGFRRASFEPAKNEQQKLRNRLAELTLKIEDIRDLTDKNNVGPKSAKPSTPGAPRTTYSKKYQALMDEQKAVTEKLDKLLGREDKVPLTRRPLTREKERAKRRSERQANRGDAARQGRRDKRVRDRERRNLARKILRDGG